MNKKENLISKLKELDDAIDSAINEVDENEKEYLMNYKIHVNNLIEGIHDDKIPASNGGLLGVLRAISEYDSLARIKSLYSAASMAEKYYSVECKEW